MHIDVALHECASTRWDLPSRSAVLADTSFLQRRPFPVHACMQIEDAPMLYSSSLA